MIKKYGEGERGMKQEKFASHFYEPGHHGSYEDLMVQIIDYCDPNDQERREGF